MRERKFCPSRKPGPEDWTKWTYQFDQKPEIMLMAATLLISREHCAVLWMRWFEYLNEYHPDGIVPRTIPKYVDQIVGQKGFAKAGTAIGWMKWIYKYRDGTGFKTLLNPRYLHHQSFGKLESIKKLRELSKIEKRRCYWRKHYRLRKARREHQEGQAKEAGNEPEMDDWNFAEQLEKLLASSWPPQKSPYAPNYANMAKAREALKAIRVRNKEIANDQARRYRIGRVV